LGRSLYSGVSGRSPPSGAHRPPAGAADLSAGATPALASPFACDAADATPLGAQAGGSDGAEGDRRQNPPSRSAAAGGSQDRWGAAVCGGVDQGGAGVRPPAGGGRTL